jgi:hypothetical protein
VRPTRRVSGKAPKPHKGATRRRKADDDEEGGGREKAIEDEIAMIEAEAYEPDASLLAKEVRRLSDGGGKSPASWPARAPSLFYKCLVTGAS